VIEPTPGWSERLKGSEEIIAWLKEKFPEKEHEKQPKRYF
jgi:hypothetical protein